MPLRHSLRPLLHLALAAGSALLVQATAATTAATAAKPATKPTAKAAATKPATSPRPQPKATAKAAAQDAAKGLALATETVEAISAAQLDVAARVLTGQADCEFNQRINVVALAGRPGYFTVSHQGKHYRMLPRETSTGAVRLEDPDNGIVWLQIPAKSMLMNARRGQRMVDGCMHAEQHAAVNAVAAAAISQGIGIKTPAPGVPAAGLAPATTTATVPVVQSDPPTPAVVVAPAAALAPPAASAPNASGG